MVVFCIIVAALCLIAFAAGYTIGQRYVGKP